MNFFSHIFKKKPSDEAYQFETLEECYQFITEVIFAKIPEPWTQGWLDAEIAFNWGQLTGDYITKSGNIRWFDTGHTYKNRSILDVFQKMSLLMKQSNQETWNKCRFSVTPDGHFSLDVSYVDSSELGRHPDYPHI